MGRRKDTSADFRETIMQEVSVGAVLDEYRGKLKAWYTETTNDDAKQTTITDKLQMDHWRRICDECSQSYLTKPLLVPNERVRICPDTVGAWGQSREIYQAWDLPGAVVPARKYRLPALQGTRKCPLVLLVPPPML